MPDFTAVKGRQQQGWATGDYTMSSPQFSWAVRLTKKRGNIMKRLFILRLTGLMLCMNLIVTGSVVAGPILQAWQINMPNQYEFLVLHGPVVGPPHTHFLTSGPGLPWLIDIRIDLTDPIGARDDVAAEVTAQHRVAPDLGGPPFEAAPNLNIGNMMVDAGGGWVAGANSEISVDVELHPAKPAHSDNFRLELQWFADPALNDMIPFVPADAGNAMTAVRLIGHGTHCKPGSPVVCPLPGGDIIPLTEVPEPNTLLLFGPGALGLIGYAWRRRQVGIRSRSCA